ncbi:hypothetical protein R1sor_024349 [Riccia sorocarpa]|uniref:Reverse transcriptase domain-containing protein n=1 Tax=Riccia sorocarpa TaxID=122646 RepID=A0ABD3GQA3_9MARC
MVLNRQDSSGPSPVLQEWLFQIRKLKHDGEECLSDHIPIIANVQWVRSRKKKMKRGSYVKMDAETLKNGEVRAKVQEAWKQGWELTPDPVTAWDMAWGRVREIFKDIRLAEREERSKLQLKKKEVEELRVKMAEGQTVDMLAFKTLEEWIHTRELHEGSILRRRSKIRWIESGKANTAYFHNVLKSKQRQEQMAALTNSSGELVTDEREILGIVQSFYTTLYQQPLTLDSDRAEREEVLRLINKRVSASENESLQSCPTMEDMEAALKDMAAGKSPGEDGVTLEVVKVMWDVIKAGCLLFIQTVWREHRIGHKNAGGIVKLLPKNEQKTLIQNWRPISLLTFGYKLIGKIISTRLKRIIPKLVDEEQCGFVEGRNIIDNVVCLKLSQDVTDITGEASIFCKLDFMKAFDRVQHQFLWDTMIAMGFSLEFIDLVKCLVADGTAKPLMRMLREKERKGELQGVNIPRGKTLLHRLFADDSGVSIAASEVNFLSMKTTIECFERISGASLNLSKSVILPMAMERLPTWIHEQGCRIMEGNERVSYLGYQAGLHMQEKDFTRDIVDKMARKLSHWTGRFLTWPAKVVLLQSVVRAIPTYQFLASASPTVTLLLKSWYKVREHLTLNQEELDLPRTLTLLQLGLLVRRYWRGDAFKDKVIFPMLKRMRIIHLIHLESSRGWRNLEEDFRNANINLTTSQQGELGVFQRWLTCVKLNNKKLEESTSWRWRQGPDKWRSWQKDTRFWRKILQGTQEVEDLSKKWPEDHPGLSWKEKWTALWSQGGSTRTKLWIWRVLRRAFFTGERAYKMQVSTELCHSCHVEMESVNHLFWTCREARTNWDRLRQLAFHGDASFRVKPSLLATIDEALERKKKGSPLIYILVAIMQLRWQDRNHLQFKGRRRSSPLIAALQLARYEVEASFNDKSKEQRWESGLGALKEINELIRTEENRTRGSPQENGAATLATQFLTIRIASFSQEENPTLERGNQTEEESSISEHEPWYIPIASADTSNTNLRQEEGSDHSIGNSGGDHHGDQDRDANTARE